MSFWWFLMLVLVGVFVSAGVIMFFSAEVDIRGSEADILFNHIQNCVLDEGFINPSILKNDFDVLKECSLSGVNFNTNKYYYIYANFSSETKELERIEFGSRKFYSQCEVASLGKAKNYPVCVRKEVPFLYIENGVTKKGVMNLLTASNSDSKKIIVGL